MEQLFNIVEIETGTVATEDVQAVWYDDVNMCEVGYESKPIALPMKKAEKTARNWEKMRSAEPGSQFMIIKQLTPVKADDDFEENDIDWNEAFNAW